MSSMNYLDEDTMNLLSLDNFLGDLDSSQFINKISKLSTSNKTLEFESSNSDYLDPKPFIKTFQLVQTELCSLSDECLSKKQIFEKSCAAKESKHYKNIIKQSSKASDLKTKFNELSLTVDKLNTNKMNPLGEKLQKANKLKENSFNIIFLTKCYNHFYTQNEPPIELMSYKQSAKESIAKTLNQLLVLSAKLSNDGNNNKLPNAENVNKLIIDFCDGFENDLLESFNSYYQSKNFLKLQYITKVLFAYNNGINIVQFFVDNHPIFSQLKDNNHSTLNDNEIGKYWTNLGDPKNFEYFLDNSTVDLLNSINHTLIQELDSIIEIFQENTNSVLISLINKLSVNIIQPRLQLMITKALSQNKLAYLRILHLFSNEIYQVIILQLKSILTDKSIDISSELDKIFSDLFVNYLKNDAYFKLEKSNLNDLIDSLINPFETLNEKFIQKHLLTDKIDSFKDQQDDDETLHRDIDYDKPIEENNKINDNDNNNNKEIESGNENENEISTIVSEKHSDFYLPDTRILREKLKGAKKFIPYSNKIRKFTSISTFIKPVDKQTSFRDRFKTTAFTASHSRSSSNNNSSSDVYLNSKDQLSLEITDLIYKYVLESLTRSTELAPSLINHYAVEIFQLMLFKIGPSYISVGLESLYYNNIYLLQQKMKTFFNSNDVVIDIDLSFLSQLEIISIQLYLLSIIIKRSFYPLILNESILEVIDSSFNAFLQDVEIGINIILNDIIELIEHNILTILSSQPVDDYMSVDTLSSVDKTITCEKLIKFLEFIFKNLLLNLKFTKNLKFSIINKISGFLLNCLILQFTKFKVNSNGSLILTQDIIHYISIFDLFEIEINDYNDNDDDINNLYYNNKLINNDGDNNENGDLNGNSIDSEKLHISQLKDSFMVLKELTNLFTCQPALLKDLCNEGKLKNLKKSVLKNYIEQRVDFQNWFLSGI